MYEVIEKRKLLPDGTEISTYTREVISANILEVEAGTTGYVGGDSGHGLAYPAGLFVGEHDLAVLGKRRRPQTGDDMSLILWLIVLGTSMSCTGISIAMQYRKSTKKDKK